MVVGGLPETLRIKREMPSTRSTLDDHEPQVRAPETIEVRKDQLKIALGCAEPPRPRDEMHAAPGMVRPVAVRRAAISQATAGPPVWTSRTPASTATAGVRKRISDQDNRLEARFSVN